MASNSLAKLTAVTLLAALTILHSAHLCQASVKCYVCKDNSMANCAPALSNKEQPEVEFVEQNCTAGCGKMLLYNDKRPNRQGYVGIRRTVRPLLYKYCINKVEWTGCHTVESAVSKTVECQCTTDNCNSAGRTGASVAVLTGLLVAVAGTA